ncbi:MAG: radical SAM protein [Thermoplasmata archaeon]|nr:MAG: radical SAM protein [Thermoplasmata archaeon]
MVIKMAHRQDLVSKKAQLISAGEIYLEPGTKLPYYPSKSTGGPDAGRTSITLALDAAGTVRIKLALTQDSEAPFSLASKLSSDDDTEVRFEIKHNNKMFLPDVMPIPTLLHAPGQAFVNLTSECKFNCLFCASPVLGEVARAKARNLDEWVEIILKASKRPSFSAVALTSGVPDTPTKTVDDIIYVVSKVREALPEVPIGVEPCIDRLEDIDRLHDAGATELKINIQTNDNDLFQLVCPGFDHSFIFQALEKGVEVFGRNKVCSNLIIGLGETDESVKEGIEHLAKLGSVVNLRVLRLNDYNRPKLAGILPGGVPEPVSQERLIELVKYQKRIFETYGITSENFETMCHRCGACDIDPSREL